MSELQKGSEIPISEFDWSFDTLRVYLLAHIISTAREADLLIKANDKRCDEKFESVEAQLTGVRAAYAMRDDKVQLALDMVAKQFSEVVNLNDSAYKDKFGAVEQEIQATREAYALRDDKIQISVDLHASSLAEIIHSNGSRYESQFKSIEANLILQLTALKDNVAIAFTASQKAIEIANIASEKRFDSVNEFRQTLTDQTATFMPRLQIETLMLGINEKIEQVRKDQAVFVGRAEIDQQFKSMAAQVTILQGRADKNEGQQVGQIIHTTDTKQNYGLIIGIAGVLIAFVSVLFTVFLSLHHGG